MCQRNCKIYRAVCWTRVIVWNESHPTACNTRCTRRSMPTEALGMSKFTTIVVRVCGLCWTCPVVLVPRLRRPSDDALKSLSHTVSTNMSYQGSVEHACQVGTSSVMLYTQNTQQMPVSEPAFRATKMTTAFFVCTEYRSIEPEKKKRTGHSRRKKKGSLPTNVYRRSEIQDKGPAAANELQGNVRHGRQARAPPKCWWPDG